MRIVEVMNSDGTSEEYEDRNIVISPWMTRNIRIIEQGGNDGKSAIGSQPNAAPMA